MPEGIARIGFFHFVRGYEQPIPSLRAELKKYSKSEIVGALIVLPETFNLGRFYRAEVKRGEFLASKPFLNELLVLSRQSGAVFVVGVLESRRFGCLPYNSAFLIQPDEGAEPLLMSRKTEDGPHGLYRPYALPFGRNRIEYGGVSIEAFVCNDYCRFAGQDGGAITAGPSPRRVLCIPACMWSDTFRGQTLTVARGSYAILANSDPDGCGSFIKDRDGLKKASFGEPGGSTSEPSNRIVLMPWDQVDAASIPNMQAS